MRTYVLFQHEHEVFRGDILDVTNYLELNEVYSNHPMFSIHIMCPEEISHGKLTDQQKDKMNSKMSRSERNVFLCELWSCREFEGARR